MSADHRIEDGRFVCTASPAASCRNYPGCECETWTVDLHGDPPAPGHEPTQQAECWIWQWLTSTDLTDSYLDDDCNEAPLTATFPDGPVEWSWEQDYMTWHYADETAPTTADEEE